MKRDGVARKSMDNAGTGPSAAPFQTPRKDRENFRKALVDIIM